LPASHLLLNVEEDRDRLFSLLDKVYNMYSEEHFGTGRQVSYIATGAALKAATEVLEECGGRVMLFANSLGGA
jgi:hypothetical protein